MPYTRACRLFLTIIFQDVNRQLQSLEEAFVPLEVSDLTPYPSYSLPQRLTQRQLVAECIGRVRTAQAEYARSRKEALDHLQRSLPTARTIDGLLNDCEACEKCESSSNASETSSFPSPTASRLKDGTLRKTCPVGGCTAHVYNMKRHLNDKHEGLTDAQKKAAPWLSKAVASNSEAAAAATPCGPLGSKSVNPSSDGNAAESNSSPSTSGRGRVTKPTAHAKPYRQCTLCKGLFVNLADHLTKKHQKRHTDEGYRSLYNQCQAVPNNRITFVRGKPVLQQPSVDNVDDESADVQQPCAQEDSWRDLALKIRNIEHDLENAEEEEGGRLRSELAELKKRYKALKFPDSREYSSDEIVWKEEFTAHLTRLR